MTTETNTQVTRAIAPKNTFVNSLDSGIETKQIDDVMFNVLVDTSKHTPFYNAAGTKETFVKTGWQVINDGLEINLQARRIKTSAEKQAKNIREKIAKVVKGKASEEDKVYLMKHGFLNETKDDLDMGKVEATYLDNVAEQAKIREQKAIQKRNEAAQAEMAQNNGSLVIKVTA